MDAQKIVHDQNDAGVAPLAQASFGPEATTTRELTVGVDHGLHARPSRLIVRLTTYFLDIACGERAFITRDGETVRADSIMGVLALGAGPGSKLHLEVRAPAAKALPYLDTLENLLRAKVPEEDILHDDRAARLGITDPQLLEALRSNLNG